MFQHFIRFQPPFNRLTYRFVEDGTPADDRYFNLNATTGAVTIARDLTSDNSDFFNVR